MYDVTFRISIWCHFVGFTFDFMLDVMGFSFLLPERISSCSDPG
jgi:hypothetical protein